MVIRFLLMNAFAVGGTIRTTFTMASELAKRHDVEVVSVYRRAKKPKLPLDPRVRLRVLADDYEAERPRPARAPLSRARGRLRSWAEQRHSLLVPPDELRYARFNLVTDAALLRFLRSTHDGVLIGTRPALNLAIARFGRPSTLRVAQEHFHLERHAPKVRRSIAALYNRFDIVATLTEGDARNYRDLLGGGGARVVAVPNAVPDVGGAETSLESDVVISAGRITRQKGFDRLIPAFSPVADKHPNWQLKIFGSRQVETVGEDLDRLIAAHDKQRSITLAGFTSHLHEEMAKASIYVMSSRYEGFPMVLLEAMACGLPVVSFDCPSGPADIIVDGETGLLVPNGDVKALASAINTLVENPDMRRSMGAAARVAVERYAPPSIAARWEELFHETATARGLAL